MHDQHALFLLDKHTHALTANVYAFHVPTMHNIMCRVIVP